jgi:hypothetical protein
LLFLDRFLAVKFSLPLLFSLGAPEKSWQSFIVTGHADAPEGGFGWNRP